MLRGKESACNAGDSGSIPRLGRSPWRREWLPTPVFLTGESHGERSLEGYSSWGHKESDVTERLSTTTGSLTTFTRILKKTVMFLLLLLLLLPQYNLSILNKTDLNDLCF